MAHVIIDKDHRCTCTQADRCVFRGYKSGSVPRCTEDEIVMAGHIPVKLEPVVVKQWFKPRVKLYNVITERKIHNL